jgi:hypothetical protein
MELDVFARKMFDDMSMRILVSWNTMNQGYALPCSFMAGPSLIQQAFVEGTTPCRFFLAMLLCFFLFATMFN